MIPNHPTPRDPNQTPLVALDFLLGQWQAISGPAEAMGGFTFVSALQSRLIVRINHADYPATENRPAFRHQDLMIIYYDEAVGLRADYYDSEGHVIRYAGKVTAPNQVIFTSDSADSGAGFRLSYQLAENGTLIGAFEMGRPDQPGEYALYLSWTARKREPP